MNLRATPATNRSSHAPVTRRSDPPGQRIELVSPVQGIPISIVVPAFNEGATLTVTLQTLVAYLTDHGDTFDWEVIVVDDGSSDNTAAIAHDFGVNNPRVRMVRHATNQQLGGALKTGFKHSRGDYIVTLDADLSYGPEHIEHLVAALRDKAAAIAIASPYAPDGQSTRVPFVRHLLSRGANQLLSAAAQGQLTTLTSMVRGYDAAFVRSLDLTTHDVGLNTEAVYKAQLLGARVVEIPAHLDWSSQRDLESHRQSSMRLRDSVRAYVSAAFRFRPAAIFVLMACLLAVSAIVIAVVADDPTAQLAATVTAATSLMMAALGGIAIQLQNAFADLYHLCQTINRQVLQVFNPDPPADAPSTPSHREGA